MKLSDMRDILVRRDIQLTKSLGQNFLHDANQLERIAAAANLSATDKILEVGPGLGPLTNLLLEKAGEVFAVEMDARLVEFLHERFAAQLADKKLNLLHADALGFLKREPRDWSEWKLVANLPYSVASPILVELSAGERAPKMIVATLQLEVAHRLMAETDADDYGILTLLVQLDFAPKSLFRIPPGSFFPAPDVDSACVVLERRATPLLPEESRDVFRRLVKKSFSQRRKMMLKLLKQEWPKEKLEAAFTQLNISLQERAEKLSLEQFVELTKLLA